MSTEARFTELGREYATGEIVVVWRPGLCYHSRNCIEALPAVFDPNRRPWVQPDAASADDVEAAVAQCPSGALRARRLDREAHVEAVGPVEVTVMQNGPLVVRGDLRIRRSTGEELGRLEKAAFCRCGNSANKPFCDGSHARVGFTDG
jgi:uncharacterized Fe-S cluster protein YjdI